MIALAFIVSIAIAAGAGGDERARAKELFDQAAVARSEGRWEEVRRLLEASIAAYPQFSTAWNLVTADEQLDDRPAAEEVLIGLENGLYGALAPKESQAVKARLDAVSKELGTIVVEVSEPGAALTVDGLARGVADARGHAERRVSAGTHIVSAAAADGRRLERSVDVGRQERRALRFSFPPPSPPPTPAALTAPAIPIAPPPPIEEERSIFSSPWLWVLIGVAAAGGATAAVLGATAGKRGPVTADINVPPI